MIHSGIFYVLGLKKFYWFEWESLILYGSLTWVFDDLWIYEEFCVDTSSGREYNDHFSRRALREK
jgi:hypothetical protein